MIRGDYDPKEEGCLGGLMELLGCLLMIVIAWFIIAGIAYLSLPEEIHQEAPAAPAMILVDV